MLRQWHRRRRPAGLEVTDKALGGRLVEALGDRELTVSVRADLPDVDHAMREMERGIRGGPGVPAALDAPGVTVERMRAFADAAREFYRAAPWQHLSDADLVHVEAPPVAAGLRHFTVLGAAGMTFGLGFFSSPKEFDALQEQDNPDPATLLGQHGKWSVVFGPIDEMPFGDADLWEDASFAVAGPSAYPVAMWYGPGHAILRPGAEELDDLTTILRALAGATEAEIDAGRWTHGAPGHDGLRKVTLAIPELLVPLEAAPERRRGPTDRRRLGLARSLDDLGRREDAIAHYRELIRLDASDCQGVRYLFLSALLLAGRNAEASTLLDQFDDPTAQWCYGRALSLFRREGDSRAARESLRAALRSNRHVPRFLTNEDDELHAVPTTYAPGTREEAMICDAELREAWRETPGAVDWLHAHAPARRSGKRRRR